MQKHHAAATKNRAPESERDIVITRSINAPLDLVWKAFSDPKGMAHWWGPNGFTTTTFEMNFRVGGMWRYVMHGPDGTDYNNWTRYAEITPQQRIVYDHGGDDPDHAMFQGSISFEASGKTTQVTLRLLFDSISERDEGITFGAVKGAEQNLARLDGYVAVTPKEKQFVITRTFAAPRDVVWRAWSEPEHFIQWWGPKDCVMAAAEMEFRPGGRFHYSMTWPNAAPMWGLFNYRDIVAPERIEFVNSFADQEGHITRAPFFEDWPLEVHNTVTFTERNGETTLTISGGPINATEGERVRFDSIFDSMTEGFGGTLDKLDIHLSQMMK
jgi:uncharacterized protein YndB with AHSA1/START domain